MFRANSKPYATLKCARAESSEDVLEILIDSPDFLLRTRNRNNVTYHYLTEEGKELLFEELKRELGR